MSALDDALVFLTNYARFRPADYPLVKSAIAELTELRAQLDEIKNFDIEDYIQSLQWSGCAEDWDKTLVAGNLRRLYFKLTGADKTLIDSDQAQYRND